MRLTKQLAFILLLATSIALGLFIDLQQAAIAETDNNKSINAPLENVKSEKSLCYKSYEEFRTWVHGRPGKKYKSEVSWRRILKSLIKKKEFSEADFEKIDFSLPGDKSYGDNPEWEFFNPSGKFKATPIPQEIIDGLTTVKNTRLVFNIRRSDPPPDDTNGWIPIFGPFEDLVVIIPNLVPKCTAEPGLDFWNADNLSSPKIRIESDNHKIVDDGVLRIRGLKSDGKTLYHVDALLHRNPRSFIKAK